MVGGFPPYGALAAGTSYRGDIGFPGNLAEIGDRNRVWYQLAWSPDPAGPARPEGRQLEVRIRGRDDLEVVMRSGSFPNRLIPAPDATP